MKLQLHTADSDIEHDDKSVQVSGSISGSITSYDCLPPDQSTMQHSGAFNVARNRPSTLYTETLEHSTSGESDSGEPEAREPRHEESRTRKSKSSGKCRPGELQPSARIRSHEQSRGEQFANSSSGFCLQPLMNSTIGSLPLNIWAILGLILVPVVMCYVYVVSSWATTPVDAVGFGSSTLWSAVCTYWNKTSSWALELTVCFFPMTAILSCHSSSTEINGVQARGVVNFNHTAGLFSQAAYSSLAGDAITQQLDLQHDFVSTILTGINQNYLPEPEGLYAALNELDNNIIPATLDSLYDFFPAVRNSETLIAGESKAFKTRLQQIQRKTKWRWLWMLDGNNWSASHDREFRTLLRKLCDRVDSIIKPREKESVEVKAALQNMKAKISTVRDQMIHNKNMLQNSKNEEQDRFHGKWRFSDKLNRISSSIENLSKTQETVSEGVTVVAGIINFVGGIRGEMKALRAIANSADLQFGEESIDGLILSLDSALNAFHARLDSKAQPQPNQIESGKDQGSA
ncbi:hypothetical protein F5B18DRAFT_654458 [Nemania serpens]|nr:hypothetical protein F5B18DRAFT_654458 [Nemania serpens]